MKIMAHDMLAAEAAAEAKTKVSLVDSFQHASTKEHAGLSYTLLADDLIIRGGQFAERRVSEIVKTVEGRDYLGVVWKTANQEVKNIIRRYFSD